MFDNEIDWVTRLECCEPAVRRAKRRKIRERIHTRPSTSLESVMIQASVQVRRVSLGVVTGTHVNAVELLSRRITGTNSDAGLKRFGSLLLGVNSMVKLLRAHGGCLGRDRR